MLVLTRKRDERVRITNLQTGEAMEVVLIRIDPKSIRLVFEAHKQYEIVRAELPDLDARYTIVEEPQAALAEAHAEPLDLEHH